MSTFVVYSRKGGQAKSTLALDLAVLAGSGTLLVDCDPQCSLSAMLLGGDSEVCAIPRERTIAAAFEGKDVEPLPVRNGLFLLPGSHQVKASSSLRLPECFDQTIVDTGPSFADGIVRASLMVATHCMTPISPEPMSVQSVGACLELFASVAAISNPDLVHLGVVLTQVRKGVSIHVACERLLRSMYRSVVLDTVLPQSASVAEASGLGKSVVEHAPKSPSSQALRKLVEELGSRLVARRAA